MNYQIHFSAVFFCAFFSCSNLKHKAYEYEIEIRANDQPFVPKKFISYKNVLFYFMFNRLDSTIFNVKTKSAESYSRFDSLACWIVDGKNNLCYKINSFTADFKITATDSLKNLMEGSASGYQFSQELRDSVIGETPYYVTDSTVYSNTDSMVFRYYFIKNTGLNTVYNFLNVKHKNSVMNYAGFTMDDYKNKYFFTNLIYRLKETDQTTQKLCEAVYLRFIQLVQ